MRSTLFLSRLKDFSLSLKPILKIAPVSASAGEPNLASSRFNLLAQQRRSLRLGRFVCFSVRVVFHILVSSSADSSVEKQRAQSSFISMMCLHRDKRESGAKTPTLKKKR